MSDSRRKRTVPQHLGVSTVAVWCRLVAHRCTAGTLCSCPCHLQRHAAPST